MACGRTARAKKKKDGVRVILASFSPRRKRLLKKIAGKIIVMGANVNEKMLFGEAFPSAAKRLARAKARAVAEKKSCRGAIVIGADTIAYAGKSIFRKTENRKIAERILRSLSGKTHTVVTGVALIFPDGREIAYSVRAKVKMKKLGEPELRGYLESGEWKGRAGCYDVSGKGRRLVAEISGEKETVVGLPLRRLKRILGSA